MSEERVSRSAGFALLAQLVGALLTAVLTIYLGRALAAAQYGSFAFALSVVAIATLFADLGITSSTGRFIAERRDDPRGAAEVFATATRMKLVVGGTAALALFALAGPICAAFGVRGATWTLHWMAISLFGESMFMLLLGTFIAIGRLRYNLVLATIESIVETGASVVLVALGAAAAGAALGRATGYLAGCAAGYAIATRVLRRWAGNRAPPAPDDRISASPRRILGYAGPLLAIDAAFRVFSSIDILLIAALVGGGAQVAAFGLPMRFAAFLDYPAGAIASAVAPRLARERGRAGEVGLLAQSLRYLLIFQMLLTAPLVIWSEAIVHLLFGSKYPGAPAVLRWLAPYVFLAGITQVATLSVNYLGEARRRVPIAVAMLAVNVAVDAILLPRIGIVGGAIGTSAAYAVWVPTHLWILRRRVGLQLRPLLITVVRSAVAGAAMVGALALLGTGRVPVPLMVAGLFAGPAAYLLALLVVRELTVSELARLSGLARRRVAA